MNTKILITKPSAGYSLIDSGQGDKLERFGVYTLARPDPQALWLKSAPNETWQKAQGVFARETIKGDKAAVGSWKMKAGVPERWQISIGGLQMWVKPSTFKHVGIFPEQVGNWDWIRDTINNRKAPAGQSGQTTEKISVLNLFGYTGGATLAAASAGAEVCHVDGSKTAISWAKDNAEISGLGGKPIRWILDDAVVFVKREVKRGKKYDGIIMDPPAFGRGPEGEVWKIEEHFLHLIDLCKQILTEKPLFFLINGYAAGYSALAYKNVMKDFTRNWGGEVEVGELTIEEEKTGRLLPAGIFGRWSTK
ncbi:TPA: SAM-dependent methyltransferase [Candidatus Taylorbacteria bacterium]|nr:SAM-dependent methyltransferase [Candidatus Taylorbacteria bacterium]